MRMVFATWLGAALLGVMTAQGASAQQKEYLRTGEALATNQYLVSSNKGFFALQQGDGNLCVYRGSGPSDNKGALWCHSSRAATGGPFVTVMQGDGNFCTYRGTPGQVKAGSTWCTQALGPGGQFFAILQGDGNLCVYRGTGPADNKGRVWCHGTNVGAVAAKPGPRGVHVVNKSKSSSWITIYSEAAWVRTIQKSGCLKAGQEQSWADVPLVAAPGGIGEKVIVRVERTTTADCSSLPGNKHVSCDTSMSWDRLDGLESARFFKKPYVIFTFFDNGAKCYLDNDGGI